MRDDEEGGTWEITEVVNPGQGRPRGVAPVQRMVSTGPDGSVFDAERAPRAGAVPLTGSVLREITYREFPVCPICESPNPTEREHVPQRAIGGHRMTKTCAKCNGDLGSRVEKFLTDWYHDAFDRVSLKRSDQDRHHNIGRIYMRQTPDGKPVVIITGPMEIGPRRDEPLTGFELGTPVIPECVIKLAALKHAYLAACLHLEEIPQTPMARAIRADLVAARDAPDKYSLPESDIAASLVLAKTYNVPVGPPLALVSVESATEPRLAGVGISLAGAIMVGWPLDLLPRLG